MSAFKTIARFPGYRFNSAGYVESSWQPAGKVLGMKIGKKWKRLKPGWHGGYLGVVLSKGGGAVESISLHIAIAEAFRGPRPFGYVCCHNDGDTSNCSLDNLRYDTHKGNCADKVKHGTMYCGERQHTSKLTTKDIRVIRARKGKESGAALARKYGVSTSNICSILRGETWKHVDAI